MDLIVDDSDLKILSEWREEKQWWRAAAAGGNEQRNRDDGGERWRLSRRSALGGERLTRIGGGRRI